MFSQFKAFYNLDIRGVSDAVVIYFVDMHNDTLHTTVILIVR